ncbi:hypothetical protein NEOLEDRAFT_1240481 [Neolentinus lepideus HHB14362 ss-1]|uniref:Fungal-type protein kinase domain-containing protein n=1 Tax=Neolentinus lepideus HHB14362 ss-1 TaxID=1314782 RepID=A0A165TUA5_9AGAM|nr:hypothetical protein NEOLEDRAFT_1240481 [Neolentinus lepideus HHB14362 ss-1]
MHNKFHGPVDPQVFLDEYLPANGKDWAPQRPTKTFTKISKAEDERALYDQWINCVKRSGFCPGYKFVATPDRFDRDYSEKEIPDVGLYLAYEAPHAPMGEKARPVWNKMALFVEFKSNKMCTKADPFNDGKGKPLEADAEDRESTRGQIIGYAIALFKQQQRTHAFSLLVLGEYVRFIRWDRAGAIFSRRLQYTQDPDMLARFLFRFSRLTPQQQGYDLTATPVLRNSYDYAIMQRGPREDVYANSYQLLFWKQSLEGDWPLWKLKVGGCTCAAKALNVQQSVSDQSQHDFEAAEQSSAPRYFLVGKPRFTANGMSGRATRGYIALDPETRELCYLKDCWRVALPGIQKEGAVLAALKEACVENVPTLVCHGDVCPECSGNSDDTGNLQSPDNGEPDAESDEDTEDDDEEICDDDETHNQVADKDDEGPDDRRKDDMDNTEVLQDDGEMHLEDSEQDCERKYVSDKRHSTLTDTTWPKGAELKNPMKPYIHYRLVVAEVGMMLEEFANSRQLVSTLYDALRAHEGAYTRAGIFHRDVSTGNILIYMAPGTEFSQGLLNDWDLSKDVSSGGQEARQPDRTGTWQYMSGALLQSPSKVHTLADDLESFIHVLIYESLRFLDSNCESVADFNKEYFDSSIISEGVVKGGDAKILAIYRRRLTKGDGSQLIIKNDHITTIISEAFSWFRALYEKLEIPRPHHPIPPKKPIGLRQLEGAGIIRPKFKLPPPPATTSAVSRLSSGHFQGTPPDIDPFTSHAQGDTSQDPNAPTNVDSHGPMMALFYTHISQTDWKEEDVMEDQLKVMVRSKMAPVIATSDGSGNKRSASQYEAEEPETSDARKRKAIRTEGSSSKFRSQK